MSPHMVFSNMPASTMMKTAVEIECEISPGQLQGLELANSPSKKLNRAMKIELVFVFIVRPLSFTKYIFAGIVEEDQVLL
jgi:hypothetical protein